MFVGGIAIGMLATLAFCTLVIMAYERSWEAPLLYWLTVWERIKQSKTRTREAAPKI